MSLLSKLFGGGSSGRGHAPVEHAGFTIHPEPIAEGGKHRLSARIEKEVDGELRSHTLIRADVLDDVDTAVQVSVTKAKQVIDEQGEALFG